MASRFAQPLNNFVLPPFSVLTSSINRVPAVANGKSKSISLAESPKKPNKIVVKFKLNLTNNATCNHDVDSACSLGGKEVGSDEELATISKSPELVESRKSERAVAGKKRKEEEKEKKQICITLSKEEIEEDIMAIRKRSGSRSLRARPKKKKRSNALQKQLDLLFPGWV